MVYCNIAEDDIEMIKNINFDTFAGYTTLIKINDEDYNFTVNVSHKMKAWESNIRGYWWLYFFNNVDKMCENIIKDSLDKVNMNCNFTLSGVSITLEIKFEKTKNKMKSIKKIIKERVNENATRLE